MNTTPNTTPKFVPFVRCVALLLTALTLLVGSHAARAANQVPFKGKGQGAIVSAIPGPAGIALRVVAAGQATHLGEFSRLEELIFQPVTGAVAGTILFIAANGDQLAGVVSGNFVSQTTAVGTYTFTAGTGRFQNATGGAAFVVTTADGVHFTVDFEGTLSPVKGP
jgi:hypothetical protein